MYEEGFEELKIEPVDEKLRRNKSNWLRHVKIMNSDKQGARNNVEL
jgi:hypothetical protein